MRLEGALRLRDAPGLRESLLAVLADGDGPVVIDLADVTDLDLSIVQLLLAARKSAAMRGVALHLVHPGPAGPLWGVLADAGFITAEGVSLTPDGDFWLAKEAA